MSKPTFDKRNREHERAGLGGRCMEAEDGAWIVWDMGDRFFMWTMREKDGACIGRPLILPGSLSVGQLIQIGESNRKQYPS